MPFCPKCKYVFQNGIGICPDCDEPLVEHSLTGKGAAMMPDDSWMVVGGVVNHDQTRVAKGSLDSSNIPSMVLPSKFAVFGTENPQPPIDPNGPDDGSLIMVPREFHDEALAILEAVLGDELYGEQADE
ncbi:MAG: hypothetical protein OEV49_08150 [candidate division Zixibacteria bacterium]|nr:hypothetical protein [candidate division Zixibacteria bacterium]MDH3936300.1 hypothetical protein [candidate division Zixibacteria bacterium]MDH4035705.1 hypothetical protein [candidate division Zixibacteria bacterium]